MRMIIVFFATVVTVVMGGSYNNGFLGQHSTCVDIPVDFKLCHGVGYQRMVLPNLLRHETLHEVKQQASSFVPLLSQQCHPHTQIFLCSLFAPVCLEGNSAVQGPIPPCRSLCESVKAKCAPVMREYTFEWPEMLNCSKYKNEHPCVSLASTDSETTMTPTKNPANEVCAPCRATLEEESLKDNYCASEFVLKIRSKRYSQNLERGEREITADRRKREVFKKGPLEKQDMKRMRLIVGGTGCRCPQLDGESSHSTKERKRRPRRAAARGNRKKKERKEKKRKRRKPFYLIMGRKVGQKLLVTVMYKWQKKNQVLKKAQKDYFSKRTCPMFGVPGDTN